jgi:hypothetical protein
MIKIKYLVFRDSCWLVVYQIIGGCHQYSIIFWDGSVYTPQEIYLKPTKAYKIGVERIRTTIGYQY